MDTGVSTRPRPSLAVMLPKGEDESSPYID